MQAGGRGRFALISESQTFIRPARWRSLSDEPLDPHLGPNPCPPSRVFHLRSNCLICMVKALRPPDPAPRTTRLSHSKTLFHYPQKPTG